MSAASFETFRKNIAVSNSDDISTKYRAITNRLNKDYWDVEQEYLHCLQVGSYGRNTAIDGVSDLDMIFELPWHVHDRFCNRQGNIQSQLLADVREKLKARYPTTKIKADGQVVVVDFKSYRVEVLPAFVEANGSYKFADSNGDGSWKWCWPKDEMNAMQSVQVRSNHNLKRVCKMIRAWKNHKGAPMSGMLIDTLCFNFFNENKSYDNKSYASYPELVRDIFTYLADRPDQAYWLAPGSKDRVFPNGKFQAKAKKAAAKCQEALDTDKPTIKDDRWKSVFGRPFPRLSAVAKGASARSTSFNNTEQFIEDQFPVDVQFEVQIECEVSFQGRNEKRIRWMESVFPIHLGRNLKFKVTSCTVPQPDALLWKVRNVGPVAEQRGIRGQINPDKGDWTLSEKTDFPGPHYVECYVIKDGVCVALDRFDVPIDSI